jgi:glyoxylase I family protein
LESEVYREERLSYKADLSLNGEYLVELFSFPDPPKRATKPEATGLRHIAFEVDDIQHVVHVLSIQNIIAEPIRVDEFTGKQFTFVSDPDDLPIEFYEK